MTIAGGDDECVIGGASYFVIDPAAAVRSAEVAFTVEEDFQGLGIGALLMRHIVAIARTQGLQKLEADVLSGNVAMLSIFRRCGLIMSTQREGDILHVVLSV